MSNRCQGCETEVKGERFRGAGPGDAGAVPGDAGRSYRWQIRARQVEVRATPTAVSEGDFNQTGKRTVETART